MKILHRLSQSAMLAVLLALAFSHATPAARAQTLIEEWGTAKFPPPPALKPAKIDAKETALLVMDFTKQTCTPERRKRCSDSVAKVLKLVTEARAKGALIIYSVAVPNSVPADILPELTPAAGEQVRLVTQALACAPKHGNVTSLHVGAGSRTQRVEQRNLLAPIAIEITERFAFFAFDHVDNLFTCSLNAG